ncbi:MAG: hypothetical protein B7Y45_09705 [Sphingomonas sp. 28-66-16]|nr:MAG: hypothetical protein B7Y45_09705 [Sphingomonas sp. 28-66-16]
MEKSITRFRSSTSRWLVGSLAGWGTLLLCLVGVGLVIAALRWFRNVATHYELTDERLIIQTGIFNKKTDEIELYRVKDVSVTYSLLNQWADIGAITIKSSDLTTGDGDLILADIPRARAIREELRTLVDGARQRRRVREIDLDMDN